MDQLHKGFGRTRHPDVIQHFVPEARVEKVQHRVLATADVEIHRHPVPFHGRIHELAVILRVNEAQVVPAGAGPLRHRIGLTTCGLARGRIGRVDPLREIGERTFSGS